VSPTLQRDHLLRAIQTVPCIAEKASWAFKWITSATSFAERLLAFACVEGVHFSGRWLLRCSESFVTCRDLNRPACLHYLNRWLFKVQFNCMVGLVWFRLFCVMVTWGFSAHTGLASTAPDRLSGLKHASECCLVAATAASARSSG
jgi:Ribonucleotide reductase, small chain